jgi:hypothetical protein
MMEKLLHYPGADPVSGSPFLQVIRPGSSLTKTASGEALCPEMQEFVSKLQPEEGHTYVLNNALGSFEYYGANINGDSFPEEALLNGHEAITAIPCCDVEARVAAAQKIPYGYPTFYTASIFTHHQNKQPEKTLGRIIMVAWNAAMHRVEVLFDLDHAKCRAQDAWWVIEKILAGKFPATSMGCKVPDDRCSICGNRAKTRHDYCEHVNGKNPAFGMGKVLADGRVCCVHNDCPRFFDDSFVLIGADKTAKVMAKIASGLRWFFDGAGLGASSAERGEAYYGGDMAKTAGALGAALGAAAPHLPGYAKMSPRTHGFVWAGGMAASPVTAALAAGKGHRMGAGVGAAAGQALSFAAPLPGSRAFDQADDLWLGGGGSALGAALGAKGEELIRSRLAARKADQNIKEASRALAKLDPALFSTRYQDRLDGLEDRLMRRQGHDPDNMSDDARFKAMVKVRQHPSYKALWRAGEPGAVKKAASMADSSIKEARIKAAYEKFSEMLKEVPGLEGGKLIHHMAAREPNIPTDSLNQLADEAPSLRSALAAPTACGMVLKPHEFQRITLRHSGMGPLADHLDNRGLSFSPGMQGGGFSFGLASVPLPVVMQLVGTLLSMIQGRSIAPPVMRRRVIMMFRPQPPVVSPSEATGPTMEKLSRAYFDYRTEVMDAAPFMAASWEQSTIKEAIFEQDVLDVRAGIKTASVSSADLSTAMKIIPLLAPAIYLNSAHLKAKQESGEKLGIVDNMIARHPTLVAALAMGAGQLLLNDLAGAHAAARHMA